MAKPTAILYVQLDVRFPDDDKIIDAGLDGAGLYAMALCRAKSLLTDGRLTRSQLRRLGGDDALIDRLIDLGLFARDAGDAVRISAWMRRNSPAAEVLDPHRGRWLAHRRHHEKRGIHNPDCDYCTGRRPPPGTTPPQVDAQKCDADADPQCDADAGPALPETETETETYLLPSQSDSPPGPPNDDDDRAEPNPPPADRQTRAVAATRLLGDRAHQAAADRGDVRATTDHGINAHRDACRAGARRDHLAAAQRHAHDHPDWTPDRIADQITHDTRPVERRTVPAEESTHPEHVRARLAGERQDPKPDPAPASVVADARARALAALNGPPTLRAVPDEEHP